MSWTPAIALAEIAPECIERAALLQRALRPSLERRAKWNGTAAEFEAAGIADYQRECGHAISDRYFRKLIKRTIDRAGETADFSHVELFLEENPKRRTGKQPVFNS